MTERQTLSRPLFEVLAPGMMTTIQDLGRFGYRRYGVPVSGAMDSFALRVANMLAGNGEESACLEMTFQGATLRALEPCYVALTGADMQPLLNDQRIDMWTGFPMKTGDVLSLQDARKGCRSYMAVSGGFHVPFVLRSRSTYVRGNFGGHEGRALKRGDVLRGEQTPPGGKVRYLGREDLPEYLEGRIVRVVVGPQDDYFTEKGMKTFLSSEYEVTSESDRMGFRLRGPPIEHSREPEIISDGVTVGAIQVPGSGMPIVAMRDAGTTGGYPKIANVTCVDLDKMAQLKPGDRIRFERVELAEAHILLQRHMQQLEDLRKKIRERHLSPEFPDAETLMRLQGAII